jgi:hypothetical protein
LCIENVTLPRATQSTPALSGPPRIDFVHRLAFSMMPSKKNWSVVRRLVGYARFEQEALPVLNSLYPIAEEYVNFLQPVLKLVDKTRDAAPVHQRYDMAQTPYRRLPSLGNLPAAAAHALHARYLAIHPIRLKTALEHAQTQLSAHGMRSHSAVMLLLRP